MYYRPDGFQERKQNTWYATILIILIPLFIFSASVNMVTRVADGYQWKFEKNASIQAEDEKADVITLQSKEIYIDESVLAQNIADYINGKSDEILTYNPEDELKEYYMEKAPDVTANDYAALDRLKVFDLILLVLAVLSFGWIVYMFIELVRIGDYDSKAMFRDKLKKSYIVLAAFEVIMFIYAGIHPVYHFVNEKILGLSYGSSDLLMNMLGEGFQTWMAVFILGVSICVTAVVSYIILVTTKPRDVFNERRYFR